MQQTERIVDVMKRMSLREKIGRTVVLLKNGIRPVKDIADYFSHYPVGGLSVKACTVVLMAGLNVGVQAMAQKGTSEMNAINATQKPATTIDAPVAAQAGRWVLVTNATAFSPRDTAEDAVFKDRLWLSNGYYHGNITHRDLWSSPDGLVWTQMSKGTPLDPVNKVDGDMPYDAYSELVVFDEKMWAVKGSVWNTDDGLKWTRVLDKTPFGARGYGETLVHNGKLWQLGSGNDVWNSSNGIDWTCVCKEAPYGARGAAAVVSYAGKLWLMGGSTPGTNTPPEKGYPTWTTHNDVWCSADGSNWIRVVEHAPWAPRLWFIAKEYAGEIWMVGGYDNVNNGNLGDVWHTRDGKEWQKFVSEPTFSPRHEPTLYVFAGSLWVVAGNSWPVKNDVWRLTLPAAR